MAHGERRWKLLGMVSAVLAGLLAKRAVTAAWKLATGNEPPANPADPETNWQEAIGWALASGAAIGIARMLASRQAANYWRRSTGSLPPGVREVS